MPARHCGESKIRNERLRAFLRSSAWGRAPQPHSVGPVGCLLGGVAHQTEEGAR